MTSTPDPELRRAFMNERADAAHDTAMKTMTTASMLNNTSMHESDGNVAFYDTFIGRTKFGYMTYPGKVRESLKVCPHIDSNNISVSCIPLSHPHFLMCPPCTLGFQTEEYEKNPNLCDCCGEPSNKFFEIQTLVGFVIITGAVCEPCLISQQDSLGIKSE